MKGVILLILRKHDEAILMLNEAIRINPNNEVSFFNKGILLLIMIKGNVLKDLGKFD